MAAQWNIYYIPNCRQAKPYVKPKFVLIVCFDGDPYGFIINSSFHQEYAEENPSYRACQVPIPGRPHTVLPHDSFIDCYDLYSFSEAELNDCRGPIPEIVINEIKRVVKSTRVIIERRKVLILEEGSSI
jgi:hypothetical protein